MSAISSMSVIRVSLVGGVGRGGGHLAKMGCREEDDAAEGEREKDGEKVSHRHYCVLNEVHPEAGVHVSTPSALMTELRAHVKVADPRWGQHAWQAGSGRLSRAG